MFSAANAHGQVSFSDGYMIGSGSFCPGVMDEAPASSNSHKEAERRRRKRINSHITTLKSILPNVVKTDKASLLGEAVRRVRELNKAAAELSTLNFYFPGETDEVAVCRCEGNGDDNPGLVKATLCCEDRPEIMLDLVQALKSTEARVMRAEMSTLGGRTMSVLWVQLQADDDAGVARLGNALKPVMEKSVQALPVRKRIRHFPS